MPLRNAGSTVTLGFWAAACSGDRSASAAGPTTRPPTRSASAVIFAELFQRVAILPPGDGVLIARPEESSRGMSSWASGRVPGWDDATSRGVISGLLFAGDLFHARAPTLLNCGDGGCGLLRSGARP